MYEYIYIYVNRIVPGHFLVCNRYFRDISILPGRTWKFYMSVVYFQVGPGTITIYMSNAPYQVRPGNIQYIPKNFIYPDGKDPGPGSIYLYLKFTKHSLIIKKVENVRITRTCIIIFADANLSKFGDYEKIKDISFPCTNSSGPSFR